MRHGKISEEDNLLDIVMGWDEHAHYLREGKRRTLSAPPTLAGGDSLGDARLAAALRDWLDLAEGRPEPSSTRIDPSWAERYMGFPEDWTRLDD